MSNRTCSVDDCNRPVAALDLCRKHYDAQRVKPPRVRDNNPRKCSVPGCVSGHSARGYCQAHYAQWRTKNGKPCAIDGCPKKVTARGWCSTHYSRWRKHGDPLAGDITGRKCEFCDGELHSGLQAGAMFCDYECRVNHATKMTAENRRKNRESTVKQCKQCGNSFSPEKSLAQEFCSKRCGMNFHRDNSGKTCSEPDCDRPFRARGMCSMHWRRWARATGREKNPVWDDRRKANWKKRYALTRGAVDAESFDYLEIYERDGWICGICAEPVDPSLEWPDPMSKSLDHIVPVTRGGSHTRDNAQCSHLGCNISKGNSVRADAMSA